MFYRFNLIEKIATGIGRIKSYYKEFDTKPEIQITANSVRVVLPNVLYKAEISLPEKEQEIIDLLNDEEFLAAREISTALGIKKTQTSKYLGDLLSKGLLTKTGNDRNVKYMPKRKHPR